MNKNLPKRKPEQVKTTNQITLRRRKCNFCHTPDITCIVITINDNGCVQNGYMCITCMGRKSTKIKPLPDKKNDNKTRGIKKS